MKRAVLPVLVLICACACAAQARAAPQEGAPALDEIFAEYWQELLEHNPLFATYLGDHRYDDRYPVDIAPAYIAASKALAERYLARVEAVNPAGLDEQDRLSREIFLDDRRRELEGYRFPDELLPVSQFYSAPNGFAQLGSGTGPHPFETTQDYENFLSRIDGFVAWVDQAIFNLKKGMKAGVVQPKILMERTVPQLASQIVAKPEDSMFYRPVANFPDGVPAADRERLRERYVAAIRNQLVPAYTKLRDFVRDQYLPACRDTVGLYALPNGEAWYDYLVRRHTTTELRPDEIHQIGLDEVARIHEQMHEVMEQVDFEGDLDAFFEFLNSDQRFYFDTREELLAGYEALRERADRGARKLFRRIPKAGFEIRAVEPFREKSASGGSYRGPSADGKRPGVFYVNAYDLSARPSWAMESLYLHEAVPGHHFQAALSLELTDLPEFRRYGSYTAFGEGWGLYAESLGPAMGFYEDPYQYFGMLNAELWRAIRLVVDTGIHAKGWSRQQVLDYMYANSATKEARAVSEAERYMAIPGQALSYKIGQLKISELRRRAERELGENFDLQAFHAQVLENGELPLQVLDDSVERWIEAERRRVAGAAR